MKYYGSTVQADDLATIEKISNQNLIDNPFFNINTRGKSTYTGAKYGVDRWRTDNSAEVINVLSTGIKNIFGASAAGTRLYQRITCPQYIIGKTVIFSAIFNEISNIPSTKIRLQFRTSSSVISTYYASSAIGLVSVTATVPKNTTQIRVGLYVDENITSTDYAEVRAMKLEIGSVSTLINDVPPKISESIICQLDNTDSNDSYANGAVTFKTVNAGIIYSTSAPTEDNLDGLKIVVLKNEPTTKYEGWLYIITE